MDPIKVDFSKKGSGAAKEIVIPPERAALKIILSTIGALLSGALAYYLMLPALNFKDIEFYYLIAITIAAFVLILVLLTRAPKHTEYIPYIKKKAVVPIILAAILAAVLLVGFLVSSVFFRARSYSRIITVNANGNFEKEIPEPDFATIPKLDEDAAANLASRALSSLADKGYVSQFTVYPAYTQINYKSTPVRVATLKYANIIKWFTNRAEGLPGYILIDMANENTKFVPLDSGMKFSPSEHFGRLLKRHLRFEYPTYMFDTATFEIDDEGNPYWICARIDKTIGLFGGSDIVGAVVCNAITGECEYHSIQDIKEKPELQWIDRVYSSSLLMEQYNYYGAYQQGFWNSILGQKNVVVTTEGCNYIAKNDDVYMYTGVTSVTSDQAITGFVLINQRTKETTFYRVDGAKEHTAMATAEGLVSDLGYKSTFPLLLNINGMPTYFMSLKSDDQVVQRYALISVKDYNKVKAIGVSVGQCLENYIDVLKANNIKVEDIDIPDETTVSDPDKTEDITLPSTVTDIRSAVINGNTVYYFKLSGGNTYYSISAADAEEAIIINVGDRVTVRYQDTDATDIIPLKSIKLSAPAAPETTAAAPAA
ncbi:MAG: CvpA family protein [Clostridiales bacterium]|nr:CvpA family protein [Clostridiales bacterium]